MSQYTTGSVSVTNGSQIITGSGTAWLTNAVVGQPFKILNENTSYIIASVDSDTQIHLNANYAGTTKTNQNYIIGVNSLTAINALYRPSGGDSDAAFLLATAMDKLDALIPYYASAMPTSGTWSQGFVVFNSAPTASNPILAWIRITTGSNNVLGTDWLPIGTYYNTYTPVVTAVTMGDLSVSYTNVKYGFYTLSERTLDLNIILTFTPTYVTATGDLQISLPFPSANITSCSNYGTGVISGVLNATSVAGYTQVVSRVVFNSPVFGFNLCGLGATQRRMAITDIPSGNQVSVYVGLRYLI